MRMLWAVAAALAGVVVVAIMAPFLRGGAVRAADTPAMHDLRVYRGQLEGVDRDLTRGIIAGDEAARLRLEIGRKVLEADRALQREAGPVTRSVSAPVMAAVLAVLAVAAFGLYQWLGVPGMPDEPIAAREAEAQRAYAARPSQAEAEATAAKTMPAPPPPDPEYAALVEQLRAAVAKRPDEPQGFALLAEHEARLGHPVAAEAAMRRLIALRGPQATADDHARLAGLMVEAAGGVITAESEAELAQALRMDPGQPQARYMQGLLMIQNHRPDRAFPIWRALLEEGPADAPWAAPIRRVITDLAWFAGEPDYQPPAENALPGPDAGAMAAAQTMSEADRQQMIQGMVANLEARLAGQGGTAQEWARLIGALHVLGNDAHAREILTEARGRFAAVPDALAAINAAAAQAGLQ